mmetsp:Transcript_16818/g.36390  ORF Transcript_16818/g.36390 Transcript_16818/m.36390 type:complete len:237 (-) Transcript_16818:647-1357(-)
MCEAQQDDGVLPPAEHQHPLLVAQQGAHHGQRADAHDNEDHERDGADHEHALTVCVHHGSHQLTGHHGVPQSGVVGGTKWQRGEDDVEADEEEGDEPQLLAHAQPALQPLWEGADCVTADELVHPCHDAGQCHDEEVNDTGVGADLVEDLHGPLLPGEASGLAEGGEAVEDHPVVPEGGVHDPEDGLDEGHQQGPLPGGEELELLALHFASAPEVSHMDRLQPHLLQQVANPSDRT